MLKFEFEGYKRINKKEARRRFEDGESIMICPSNLRPFSLWHPEVEVQAKPDEDDFDKIINMFEYYNCVNTETGKYTAFYLKADTKAAA